MRSTQPRNLDYFFRVLFCPHLYLLSISYHIHRHFTHRVVLPCCTSSLRACIQISRYQECQVSGIKDVVL